MRIDSANEERLDSATKRIHNQRSDLEMPAKNVESEVTRKQLEFEESNGIEIGKDGQPHPSKGRSLIGKVYESMENSRDPVSDTVGDGIRALAKKLRPEKK